MTDYPKALAALREALDLQAKVGKADTIARFAGHARVTKRARDLLAALEAARGEAVATVQPITSLGGETRKVIIGKAEVIDALPVGTAVYLAPPAPPAAAPEGMVMVSVEPTTAMKCRAVEAWEGPAVYKSMSARWLAYLEGKAADCWAAMLAAALAERNKEGG